MSQKNNGRILWQDITVPDAGKLRDFYCEVMGWKWSAHDMGDYDDYNIETPDGQVVAGICHARGSNAGLPPQWLNYVQVADVQQCVDKCLQMGGKVVDGPRPMGKAQFAVLQDPAGAYMAVIESTAGE